MLYRKGVIFFDNKLYYNIKIVVVRTMLILLSKHNGMYDIDT